MIGIEGIPVDAARLANAEKAKSRQTRNKRPKGRLLPIALQPGRLRPDALGQKCRSVRMKLDSSRAFANKSAGAFKIIPFPRQRGKNDAHPQSSV